MGEEKEEELDFCSTMTILVDALVIGKAETELVRLASFNCVGTNGV